MRYRRIPHGDHIMRSGLEVEVAKILDEANCEYEYESMRIPYTIPAYQAKCGDCASRNVVNMRYYLPDFYIPATNIIIEVKGKFTVKDRKKHLAIKEQLPFHDIRIWFSRDDKLTKKDSTRNTEWCAKHGIPCHVGLKEVPMSWLKKTT